MPFGKITKSLASYGPSSSVKTRKKAVNVNVISTVKPKKKKQWSKALVCKSLGGFPDRYYCTLKTSYTNTVTFAAQGYSNQFIALNGYTPLGSQYPSQLAMLLGQARSDGSATAPYINYCVQRCFVKVELTVAGASTGQIAPMCIILPMPKNINSWTGTANSAKETTYSKYRALEDDDATSAPLVLSKKFLLKPLSGTQNGSDLRSNENMCGTYAAAPANTYYCNVLIATNGSSSVTDATYAVSCSFTIYQDYEFFNRNCNDTSAPA